MPLERPVQYYSQNAGPNGPPVDDPLGCWYACAKMMGVYFEGNYFTKRKGVSELTNPDGTHQAIGGGNTLQIFQMNEKLEPLPSKYTLKTPADYDLVLTERGPIMFSWWAPVPEGGYIYHASVIVGVLERDIVFHDPAMGANQSMSPAELDAARGRQLGVKEPMLVRMSGTLPPKQVDIIAAKGISYASDSYTKK